MRVKEPPNLHLRPVLAAMVAFACAAATARFAARTLVNRNGRCLSERRRVRQMVQRAGVSVLLTLDDRGLPSGRPMLPLLLDDDPRLYFLTHRMSRKVSDVAAHPAVTLTVTDSSFYAVLIGRASVLKDPALIKALWRPTYRAWFPDGKDDAEATVLCVEVERVDYWEPPRSRLVRVAQAVRARVEHRSIDTPMKTIEGL